MKIQSLSVVVPSVKCINHCEFCVACMRPEPYLNQLDYNKPFYDHIKIDINNSEFIINMKLFLIN